MPYAKNPKSTTALSETAVTFEENNEVLKTISGKKTKRSAKNVKTKFVLLKGVLKCSDGKSSVKTPKSDAESTRLQSAGKNEFVKRDSVEMAKTKSKRKENILEAVEKIELRTSGAAKETVKHRGLNKIFNNMDKINYRAEIEALFLEGVSPQKIHKRLLGVYKDSSPSLATVYNWVTEFKRGRTSLEDIPRIGRPKCASTPETVAKVQDLVLKDRRLTKRSLAEATGISNFTANHILTKVLGMKKLNGQWVQSEPVNREKTDTAATTCKRSATKTIEDDESTESKHFSESNRGHLK